jgi:hypothetical protein
MPKTLHVILIAAVLQGWGLYGLGWAADHRVWPSTSPGLSAALYALVTVLPLTLQFLAEHASRRLAWLMAAGTGLVFAGFGWHFGHSVSAEPSKVFFNMNAAFEHTLAGLVLWLMLLPFLQTRLVTGKWWPQYPAFFAQAWRNKLTLAEAALFTILLWALFWLWGTLFGALGIALFKELFAKDLFAVPVTWLAFGVALHLVTGMDRLTTVLLQQLLGVLKWLALPAALILGLFSIALVFKLPELFGTGKRVIAAAHLLWLMAVIVLLLNAAYREGEAEQPYPRAIGTVLRAVAPLSLIVVLTAVWSLRIRSGEYGLTPERVWAWIVCAVATACAVGYTVAAFRRGQWMRGMGSVNLVVIVGTMVIVASALTPLLSPYRLTANSQYRRAIADTGEPNIERPAWLDDSYRTLRFSAGAYGSAKLEALASLKDGPRAAQIRELATEALHPEFGRYGRRPTDYATAVAKLAVYPSGRTLDAELRTAIEAALKDSNNYAYFAQGVGASGLFVDLNADGTEEFVLTTYFKGLVFQKTDTWSHVADAEGSQACKLIGIEAQLASGHFGTRPSEWADLVIDERPFRVEAKDCAK